MKNLKYTDRKQNQIKNSLSLPFINSSSKKIVFKPNFVNTSIKAQKYKLDVKKFESSLIEKKKILNTLKKECEQIKQRDKSSDKIISRSLKLDSNEISMNNSNEIKFLENDIRIKDNRVKNYKESRNNLEFSRKEFNTRNDENNRIKYEIDIINNEIRNIENKIDERSNDVRNIKIKIEFAEKNICDVKRILDDNKEKNKKLNYIKELELQRYANINKLNETNKTITNNEIEINELRKKLEDLSKNK